MVARRHIGSKVRHSRLVPDLLGGVPRMAAVMNGTIGAALLNATRNPWLLCISIGLHAAMVYLTKHDPEWFAIKRRYWKTKRFYGV